jgi:hypothetical protein
MEAALKTRARVFAGLQGLAIDCYFFDMTES